MKLELTDAQAKELSEIIRSAGGITATDASIAYVFHDLLADCQTLLARMAELEAENAKLKCGEKSAVERFVEHDGFFELTYFPGSCEWKAEYFHPAHAIVSGTGASAEEVCSAALAALGER